MLNAEDARAAVDTMTTHGINVGHFQFLSLAETEEIMRKPHNFPNQTVAFKESSAMTKPRHVSNPSSV